MKPYLTQLNEQQLAAVTSTAKYNLVIAGAGSGKTRVLTSRIPYIIDQGIPPANILAVTFTNKAAREMAHRLSDLLDTRYTWIGTFHSCCLRILKSNAAHIGMDKGFNIYDDSDQRALVRECLRECGFQDKQWKPRQVLSKISWAKNSLTTPEELTNTADGYYDSTIAKVYTLYEQKLRFNNALDFDGILTECLRLLLENPEVQTSYENKFRSILIDEYQDINTLQYQIIRTLAGKDNHLFVVGDPDQAIYSWRNADITNILNFEKDYPDCAVYKLEQNYRSTNRILKAANSVINAGTMLYKKDLWTQNEQGETITLISSDNANHEAHTIVQCMRELSRQRNIPLRDMVCFYRIHPLSRAMEDALRRANVPYRIFGGVSFYNRREVKDLIAYLKFVVNRYDTVNFNRVANIPTRGLGKKSKETITQYIEETRTDILDSSFSSSLIKLTKRARTGLDQFIQSIRTLIKLCAEYSLDEAVKRFIETINYMSALDDGDDFQIRERKENVHEFVAAIRTYLDENPAGTLATFLEEITLQTSVDTYDEDQDCVSMMTLHCAKGLEFPVAFIVGLEEGILPHSSSQEDLNDYEEERRLLYVGMTRAKKKLFLSYANTRYLYGYSKMTTPSPFLNDIPQSELSYHDPYGIEEPISPFDTTPEPITRSTAPGPEIYPNFVTGQEVYHSVFGKGIVVKTRGRGKHLEVDVHFEESDKVLPLAARAAKLQPV